MTTVARLPYWQVNVPEQDRTEACPPFLQNLAPKELRILSTPDDDYHILNWAEARAIVAANRIDLFQRVPSELRRYRAYLWDLARRHGSVMNFIMAERLRWADPIVPRGRPFELLDGDGDVKILYNDWPYGIDSRIVHLVVWTKFELEEDPETGDLTDQARAEIDAYVEKVFHARVPSDQVLWFKNWKSLKSVHTVEHFHVMLFDPDPSFVEEITNGDVPMSQKLQNCDVAKLQT